MKTCECGCGLPTRIATRTDRRAGQNRGEPLRFLSGHATTRKRPPGDESPARCACGCGGETRVHRGVARRFIHGHNAPIRRITEADYAVEARGYKTPCWIWRWAGGDRGRLTVRGVKTTAYRAMYEQQVGAVPAGRSLHHLCEVPACIRPDHLEPLTQSAHIDLHRADLVRGQHRLIDQLSG